MVQSASISSNKILFSEPVPSMQIEFPSISNLIVPPIGAAFLAGLAIGFWKDRNEIQELWKKDKSFQPDMEKEKREKFLHFWHKAVERSKNWVE